MARFIGKTLGKYIIKKYLRICSLLALAITALAALIDFAQNSSNLSALPHTLIYSAIITIHHIPLLVFEILPFVILLSAIIFFFIHNKNYELIIMRSIGVSAWQFIAPICGAAFFIALAAILILNPISAFCVKNSQALIAQWKGKQLSQINDSSSLPWLIQKNNDGTEIDIKAEYLERNVPQSRIAKLLDSSIKTQASSVYNILLNADFIITSKDNILWYKANKVVLLPNYWLIVNAQCYDKYGRQNEVKNYRIPTNIKADFLEAYASDPKTLAFYELPKKIAIARHFGYSANKLQVALQRLIAFPALLIAMVLTSTITSLQFSRSANMKFSILPTMLVGFALYIAIAIARNFAKIGLLSPIIASWMPICFAILLSLLFLLKQEDG